MPLDDEISRELESTENLNTIEKFKTAKKKVEFINDIKTGLGTEIKINPSKVKIIKKTPMQKFKIFLKKLFTKF